MKTVKLHLSSCALNLSQDTQQKCYKKECCVAQIWQTLWIIDDSQHLFSVNNFCMDWPIFYHLSHINIKVQKHARCNMTRIHSAITVCPEPAHVLISSTIKWPIKLNKLCEWLVSIHWFAHFSCLLCCLVFFGVQLLRQSFS